MFTIYIWCAWFWGQMMNNIEMTLQKTVGLIQSYGIMAVNDRTSIAATWVPCLHFRHMKAMCHHPSFIDGKTEVPNISRLSEISQLLNTKACLSILFYLNNCSSMFWSRWNSIITIHWPLNNTGWPPSHWKSVYNFWLPQTTYSCLSVSLGDWLQDTPWITKSEDVQVPCTKWH